MTEIQIDDVGKYLEASLRNDCAALCRVTRKLPTVQLLQCLIIRDFASHFAVFSNLLDRCAWNVPQHNLLNSTTSEQGGLVSEPSYVLVSANGAITRLSRFTTE